MVFGVSYLVDDSVELGHDMKQVEDNFHMREALLDRQDRGIPHIHHNGFQSLPLFFGYARKEFLQGPGFSVFAYPEDSPCQVVQNHRQVAMALADGNLVDGQDAKSLVVGSAIWSFQEPLVDGFDRFPIQPQMPGHLSDGHDLAQLVDVVSQSFGDPEIRIEQIEIFDGGSVALKTGHLSVLALDPDSGRSKVEIPKHSFLLAVDSGGFGPTKMTNRMESFIGNGFDPSPVGAHRARLLDNTDSWKREIMCYT